ncbi:Golgi SNAP receptor complex member 1-1-like isoform X2 [Actinidia eriantha]|nr:Golgi SNAP receptor complex member 1-1-like isoform X2 [Actinidia eriantha]
MAMEKERKDKKCDKGKYIDLISSKSGAPSLLIGEYEKSIHTAEKRRLQGKKRVCEARKLEAQLDEQMHLYRKLVTSKTDDGIDKDLESGIDQLLQQLQLVNSHMQAWVSSGGSEIFSHTLTRHQEILQDLTQEFNRLRSSLRAKKEHASLLEDFREFDRSRLDLEDGGGSYDQALLKEHASISRSTGQMDSVISQAQETIRTLVYQRSTFGGINTKLSNISSRLPTVNHILSAIKKKKSMDTIILSLVASVCTFLILIYWFTK